MIKKNLLFGSQMHWATGLVIAIELFFVIYQIFKCLECHSDKKRQLYLFLLILLLLHTFTLRLFPDGRWNISLPVQYLLLYGIGWAILAYCTFYFYRFFAISTLQFHAKYGIWLFLVIPYFSVFLTCYDLTRDIDLSIRYGVVIPVLYSFFLVFTIALAIYKKYKHEQLKKLTDIILLFVAIFPLGLVSFIATLGLSPIQELLLSIGFLPFLIFYTRKEFRAVREKEFRIQTMDLAITEKDAKILYLSHLLEASEKMDTKTIQPTNSQTIVERDAEISHLRDQLETLQKTNEENVQSMNQIIVEIEAEIRHLHHLIETIVIDDTSKTGKKAPVNVIFEENCKKHLTQPQIDVIKLVNTGLTYKKIAEMQEKSESYIKKIMSSICIQLKVRTKANVLRKLNT